MNRCPCVNRKGKEKKMDVPWAVTPEKVERAIRKIIEVSHPRRLVLFGSYIRGDMDINSDLDILVVTSDEIESPRKESVRLRRAIEDVVMPVDILVITESLLAKLKDTPGLIYKEALQTGRIVYEST
jgi:predicted nucleotidyltransferase